MSIPKVVLEAEARANAAIQSLTNQNAAPAAAPAPEPIAQAPAPAAPVGIPAPAPTIGLSQTPQGSVPADDGYKHRYEVLQGKYNAEVPRLSAALDAADATNKSLEVRVKQLEEQLSAIPKEAKSLVRPEEVEHYGQPMVDMVRRAAREENASLLEEIARLKSQLEAVGAGVAKTQQMGFFEVLAQAHPDWAVVNGDERFHRWLGEIDVLSGLQRNELLLKAQREKDGARASAIFTAYKKDTETWAANANSALQEQVVPAAGSAGGGAAVPVAGRTFTRLEVQQHYDAIRSGRLKGAEAAAAEAEIQKAMLEGRIR